MLNVGAGEMILIALVLLIAVGPEQLPGVIRRAGQIVAQARTMGEGLRRDFMSSMDELERAADIKGWAEAEIEAATGDEDDDDGSSAATATGEIEDPVWVDPFDPATKRVSSAAPNRPGNPAEPAEAAPDNAESAGDVTESDAEAGAHGDDSHAASEDGAA